MPLTKLRPDSRWEERKESPAWLIGLTTFGILALELALIRWSSSQMRVFAYFNNMVLIAAFLGMGLGVAVGRRHPGLVHLVLRRCLQPRSIIRLVKSPPSQRRTRPRSPAGCQR